MAGPNNCSICSHRFRTEIELAFLNSDDINNASKVIEQIAIQFDVSEADLKLHAILHSPVSSSAISINPDSKASNSLARQLKIKEADILTATVNEFLVTMTAMGRRIRTYIADEDSINFEKLLTKAVADLYLGTGGQIRDTVKLMADINAILNDDQNSQKVGMMALAHAINSSKPNPPSGQPPDNLVPFHKSEVK